MPASTAYLIVGVAAALTTALATPVIRRAAVGAGLVVAPDERHVHEYAMPNLGGLAMLAGLVAGLAVAWGVGDFSAVFATPREMIGLLVAATLVCAIGTLDDVRPVSAPAKVAGMVAAGSVLSLAGVSLLVLRVPFLDLILLSPDLSALFTVVWVVLIANAVNLIDGLDGLATGIVGIAAATFLLYAVRLGDAGVLTVCRGSRRVVRRILGSFLHDLCAAGHHRLGAGQCLLGRRTSRVGKGQRLGSLYQRRVCRGGRLEGDDPIVTESIRNHVATG